MNVICRLLPRTSRLLHVQYLYISKPQQPLARIASFLRPLSTAGDDNDPPHRDGLWNLSQNTSADFDSFLNDTSGDGSVEPFTMEEVSVDGSGKLDASRQWNLDEEVKDDSLFGADEPQQEVLVDGDADEEKKRVELEALEREEKELLPILEGPNRAFGDLIAAAGITDAMLDSLIALKDFEGVQGLPPLSEIEEMRYEKSTKQLIKAEMERQKLEEAAKARVRKVDAAGRAYGTGKRKCSIARVWIQPGNGKFIINDKDFDAYFPMLDHRASLLLPFSETKTLGLWDVRCHVQGGGVSGQVGAIQLGISRALQNWEPDLRPPLRSGGFLTRDPRVVERKKPGRAKARKSFQWVKR